MKVRLESHYVLTDEHPVSTEAQPVLVNQTTERVFGPMDIFEASESYGTLLARAAVKRMHRRQSLTDKEREFIERFTKPITDKGNS